MIKGHKKNLEGHKDNLGDCHGRVVGRMLEMGGKIK